MNSRRATAVLACALVALVGAVSPAAADTALPAATDSPLLYLRVDGGSTTRNLSVSAAANQLVTGVSVSVDLRSVGATCLIPLGDASDNELSLSLAHGGTTVPLVTAGSLTGGANQARATATFSGSAASSMAGGRWRAGTFTPASSLGAFNGLAAAGTWTLTIGDSSSGDPKCYYGATLNVTAAVRPVLPGGTLAAGTVGAAYPGATIVASAGDIPITYAVASGSLPAGLTMSAAGAISGTPTTSGTFTFGVTGTNNAGTSAAATYSISVAPSLVGGALPAGTVGTAYSSGALSSDTGITGYALTSGSLPAGLALDPTTGVVGGTPATSGASSFEVTATASTGTSTAAYSIDVLPALPGGALTGGSVGSSYSATVATGDTGVTGYAVTSGALPAGLALGATTGAITGTPTTSGPFSFGVTASSGTLTSAEAAYSIAVTGVLPGGALAQGQVGSSYSAPVQSSDAGITAYSVTSGALPGGLGLDPATGAISGTATTAGLFSFQVGATSGPVPATPAWYSIGVLASLPGGDLGDGTVGEAYSAAVLADTTGVTRFALASGAVLPAGLTLSTTTGVISGTPTVPGDYTVRVRAQVAGVGWTGANYSIGVLASLPGGDLGPGTVGSAFSAAVLADTTGIAQFALGDDSVLPAGLTLDPATGVISGTPTVPGDYAFRVRAHVAGVGWSGARYTIGVLASLPGGYLKVGAVGSAYSDVLLADPTGVARFHLTAASDPLPAGLVLDEATGEISGTPTVAGIYEVTARARVAGVGGSEPAVYRIVVLPSLVGTTLPSVRAGHAMSAVLGDPATGIDRFALAPGSALAYGLSLDPLTGVLSGTPRLAGTYAFQVLAVNDAAGVSVPVTFTLVVTAAPASADELAATGANALSGLVLALGLLAAGGALVVVRRRAATR